MRSRGKRKLGTGIYLRGSVYWFAVQRNGKRHFITLETSDPAEAVRRVEIMRDHIDLESGAPLKTEVDRFIAYKQRQQEYTRSSAVTKRNKLLLFAASLPPGTTAATVTTRQVQRFYDDALERTGVDTTALGYVMAVRAFFRWAVESAHVARRNPVKGVKVARTVGRARKDFCNYGLRDRLVREAPNGELRFILFCGFHAGLRFQEIVEARPFWFDLDNGRVHLRKTTTMNFKDREERSIPLTIEFQNFLKSYGLRAPFMLRPDVAHGKSLYRYDFRASFMKYVRAQGCEGVTPHTMRHTFASLLVSAGESIYKVAVWLGDEVATVQKHYGHLTPDNHGIEKAFSERALAFSTSGNSPASSREQQASRSTRR
jgi:integrase